MTRFFLRLDGRIVWAQSDDVPEPSNRYAKELTRLQYIDHCDTMCLTPIDENGDPLT